MASGFGRVAEALAIGVGGAMEGFGKGTQMDYMNAREQYMEDLRAQRAAASKVEERAFEKELVGEEREWQKEKFGEEKAWEREKFGIEQAAEDKRFGMQMRLRQAGGEGGGGKRSAELQEIDELAGILAKEEGLDAPTNKHKLAAWEKVNARSGGSGGGGNTEPSAVKVARFKAIAKYGADATDAQVAEFLGTAKDNTVKPDEWNRSVEAAIKIVDPQGIRTMSDPASVRKEAEAVAAGQYKKAGIDVPYYDVEAEPEAAVEAPATTTKGDDTQKDVPKGQGNERDPYHAENATQLEWIKRSTPKGQTAYVRWGDKVLKFTGGS